VSGPAGALLRVRGLGRDHGEVVALDGLDLDVPRGRCVAVVGHNGSGKSTVVRCLGGQLEPSRGSIEIDGRDAVADPVAAARRRAVVPDPSVTTDGTTVREQLERVASAHGLGPRAGAAVDHTLELLGLTSRQHAAHHQLSRGLRRRAELALGLVRPADLLVLDEPTAYLDEVSVEVVVRRLAEALEDGTGIVLTTHDPDVARFLADEVVVLEDGRVADRGTPEQVLAGAAAERAGLAAPDGPGQ
jgi:ABC-2 type transport system ATP-binding protein